jgi:coenzyme F420 hydrogenase subunit beta
MSEFEKIKTIEDVADNFRCYGCGSCAAVCPVEAISYIIDTERGIYLPSITNEKCILCEKCYTVCPVEKDDIFEKGKVLYPDAEYSRLSGYWIKNIYGWSCNDEIRVNCSSGGLVTELLIYLLENKYIDGAILTKMKDIPSWHAEGFIARTKTDIIKARGSKYCPNTLNSIFKHVKNMKNKERYAFVGLPCHVQGFRNLQSMELELQSSIKYVFGIFCGHCPSFNATLELLNKYKIRKEDHIYLKYRGNGWPGRVFINRHSINYMDAYKKYLGKKAFVPNACKYCNDIFAELADASFGDAWLPEFRSDKKGVSVALIRKKEIVDIFNEMKNNKRVYFKSLTYKKMILSQISRVLQKKKGCLNILHIIKTTGLITFLRKYFFYIKRWHLTWS